MQDLRITNVICDYSFSTLNQFNVCKYGRSTLANNQIKNIFYPILRIFGILDTGEKCCAYIHGYLPYVLIRSRCQLTQDLHNYLLDFINECITQHLFQLNPGDLSLKNIDEIIYGIYQETGRSFYGYYESLDYFVRIYFYNPLFAKAFASVLQKECERLEWLQPYNSHIPFTLQFFIDFSLYGMDYVYFYKLYHRKNCRSLNGPLRKSPLSAVSHCSVEFDIFTDDIMNPFLLDKRKFESIGLDFIWREEQQRCELLRIDMPELSHSVWASNETRQNSCITKCETEFQLMFEEWLKFQNGNINLPELQQNSTLIGKVPKRSNNNDLMQHSDFQLNDDLILLENEDSRSSFDYTQQIWENQEYRSLGFEVDDNGENNLTPQQRSEATLEQLMEILVDSSTDEEENELNSNVNLNSNNIRKTIQQQKQMLIGLHQEKSHSDSEVVFAKNDAPVLIKKANFLSDNNQTLSIDTLSHTNYKQHMVNNRYEIKMTTPTNLNKKNSSCANLYCPTPRTPLSMDITLTERTYDAEENLLHKIRTNVYHLCALSLEVLTFPRCDSNRIVADPRIDQIYGVTFSYHDDICNWQKTAENSLHIGGIILKEFSESQNILRYSYNSGNFIFVQTEREIFEEISFYILRIDPELLIGYNTKRYSWGYLFDRARILQFPFAARISRIKTSHNSIPATPFYPPFGRLIIETWWNVRKERPMRCYRMSNVAKELLHVKFPALEDKNMAEIFNNNESGLRTTLVKYFIRKSMLNLHILAHLDFFVRTTQMARVYGIQFEGVLTRGSQFRVESMLLRLAVQQHFFAPSISVNQRSKMLSPECIPLNMEPKSGIYRDPIVVLDFQSLYPSIAIAYNYCFSTCLGKIANFKRSNNGLNFINIDKYWVEKNRKWILFGALPYLMCAIERLHSLLKADQLTFSPNGAIFVKKQIRNGLIPIMLQELLDTRVMVKNAIKNHRGNQKLTNLLDARQLALKLIANVTYGYTAANWSGRMPCEEVADAIVHTGRLTLERAIEQIGKFGVEKYRGAKVIYGDTDSLFILCKGCSREDAFKIGQQIADDITNRNPYPVKMKFEKIMHPCCIIAKKRYVGVSYERVDEKKGKFDAKGIETIRRDSPPFVAKIMEHFLRLFFDESSTSAFHYLEMRLSRLQYTEVDEFFHSIDYIGTYAISSKSPAHKIAIKLAEISERLKPVYGERLTYVIAMPRKGINNRQTTLFSNVVSVDCFLRDPKIRLNFNYYVKFQLFPALQRVLDYISIKLKWKNFKPYEQCLNCEQPGEYPWCLECEKYRFTFQKAYSAKMAALNSLEKLRRICRECIGPVKSVEIERFTQCLNFSCPVKRKIMAVERHPMANALDKHIFTQQLTPNSLDICKFIRE